MKDRPSVRALIEAREVETLSPRATLSARTRGRKRRQRPCPLRTEFQRDRDRILHSKSFRRLSHKTQVFIAPLEDHYRTRLTHTLEVAQIGRTIARALRLNEDLTEAIALGHDLGHTPYGHAGETALAHAYRCFDSSARFTHYEQSLRVVEDLENGGKGLNLTWEVRDGILRHSKGRDDLFAVKPLAQWPKTGQPATLEGQIIRIADRVAYINHDIDDALRAGLLSQKELPSGCVKVLGATHSQRITAMVKNILESSEAGSEIVMSEPIASATEELKEFLFTSVYIRAGTEDLRRRVSLVIQGLFQWYMEQPEHLPRSLVGNAAGDAAERARAVCDYIAGMTDRFATQQFLKHLVPSGWRSEE